MDIPSRPTERRVISATISRSRELADGSWAWVELSGAQTADVDPPGEPLSAAAMAKRARELGAELDLQVIDLLAARQVRPKVVPPHAAAADVPNVPQTSACPDHGVPFVRYTSGDESWYSHPVEGGAWCRRQN